VHRRSEVSLGGNDDDWGLLGSTLQAPRAQQTALEVHALQDDDDENILHLWERVDRLSNRLTRISHFQSRVNPNDVPPRLSLDEITCVIEPLKARFQKTATQIHSIQLMGEKRLAEYSQERLKHLLASFPTFTTRKRVYFKGESGAHSRTSSTTLQSRAFNTEQMATLSVIIFSTA
jgi:hypothetical protein